MSGAGAPARLNSACASGRTSGLSHGPLIRNGSSKLGAASRPVSRLATPLRSSSRAGTDAEPMSATRSAGISVGEAKRAARLAAERLRFANRHGQVAAAQIGRYRGAPELDVAKRHAAGRQPQIDVEAGQARERDRLSAPLTVAEQAEG